MRGALKTITPDGLGKNSIDYYHLRQPVRQAGVQKRCFTDCERYGFAEKPEILMFEWGCLVFLKMVERILSNIIIQRIRKTATLCGERSTNCRGKVLSTSGGPKPVIFHNLLFPV